MRYEAPADFFPCCVSCRPDFCTVDFLVSKDKSAALWPERQEWSWGSEEEDVHSVEGLM